MFTFDDTVLIPAPAALAPEMIAFRDKFLGALDAHDIALAEENAGDGAEEEPKVVPGWTASQIGAFKRWLYSDPDMYVGLRKLWELTVGANGEYVTKRAAEDASSVDMYQLRQELKVMSQMFKKFAGESAPWLIEWKAPRRVFSYRLDPKVCALWPSL